MATGNRKLTEPLESTTLFFGLLFAAALLLGALATLVGTGTVGGIGHAQVCVTDTNIGGGSDGNPFAGTYAAKPGAQLQPPNAPLSACALHPGFGQLGQRHAAVGEQVVQADRDRRPGTGRVGVAGCRLAVPGALGAGPPDRHTVP